MSVFSTMLGSTVDVMFMFATLQTSSVPYPDQPVDLDAYVERDTWMDQDREVVVRPRLKNG